MAAKKFKKMLRINLGKIDFIPTYYGERYLDNLIDDLQEIKNEHQEKGSLLIEFDTVEMPYSDGYNTECTLWATRLETDQEFQDRKIKEKEQEDKSKKAKEERHRLYLQLHKEFGENE